MLEKAIKHFESLQKRYTTQHNGKMCEYVAIALEAMKKQLPTRKWHCGNYLRESFGVAYDCPFCREVVVGVSKYCPNCGNRIDSEQEEKV